MHRGPEEWEALLALSQSVYLSRYTLCGNVSVMFLGLALTHVHRVGDVIQPAHPLLSPSPAFNLSQHPDLFQ